MSVWMSRPLLLFLLLLYFSASSTAYDPDYEEDAVEVTSIKNDNATIIWRIPEDIGEKVTRQRLMIFIRPGEEDSGTRQTYSVIVKPTVREYTFERLAGNTSYRASVEAFEGNRSVWYGSNILHTSLAALDWLPAPKEITLVEKTNNSLEISWSVPTMLSATHQIINQHFLNVYEYHGESKVFSKKFTHNILMPRNAFNIESLSPGTVYNITIQAGTSLGYGHLSWSTHSTLPPGDAPQLFQKHATPNSMILKWDLSWMSNIHSKCTVKARSLNMLDGLELVNTGIPDVNGNAAEFSISNLRPSTAYNISVTTSESEMTKNGRLVNPLKKKMIWGVFSTLIQGEYTVGEPRIVVETDHAVSIVFQPMQNLGDVTYQIKYAKNNDPTNVTETEEMDEGELRCPKYGCAWMCALIFNLPAKPRELSFEVRAKVDGLWNKWTPIPRRPWNVAEITCSINPPPYIVHNLDDPNFQREIELSSADVSSVRDVWRYLIVVDRRDTGRYSSIDITKLADKVMADMNHLPYYITGAITPSEYTSDVPFALGDGVVRGGYLNYPLEERSVDPRWTLVPLTQTENELMEPRLRTCGFNEDGSFDCDLSWDELVLRLPWWAKLIGFFCLLTVVIPLLILLYCLLFKCRRVKDVTRESNMMYYTGEPSGVATEYRRVETRGFITPEQDEERIQFMNS